MKKDIYTRVLLLIIALLLFMCMITIRKIDTRVMRYIQTHELPLYNLNKHANDTIKNN